MLADDFSVIRDSLFALRQGNVTASSVDIINRADHQHTISWRTFRCIHCEIKYDDLHPSVWVSWQDD